MFPEMPVARIVYWCPAGHELDLPYEAESPPVCEPCSPSGSELVLMELVR